MSQGTVVTIVEEKGFGFIRPDGQPKSKGKDLFFHATGMLNRMDFTALVVGQKVDYTLDESGERPRAIDVQAASS